MTFLKQNWFNICLIITLVIFVSFYIHQSNATRIDFAIGSCLEYAVLLEQASLVAKEDTGGRYTPPVQISSKDYEDCLSYFRTKP